MPETVLPYTPQTRQALLHQTKARQILYGGAAGGGKSKAIRWDGILFCIQNPGCQAYLFRRTLPELEKNHIVPLKTELAGMGGIGKYDEVRNRFEFSNGSILWMCYCERETDVLRYQGAEIHWLGVDEGSQLSEFQIGYLRTRNRLGGWKPEADAERLPRTVIGSNPGGPGHNFLKLTFIDPAPAESLFHDPSMKDPRNPDDNGWTTIFIPAKIRDNIYIDPGYEASFGGLPPEMAAALREGDWDAVVGQALHILSRERHMVRPFVPPRHWTRFMAIDWGLATPFSVGWYTVSDGVILRGREGWEPKWLPAGSVIRYAEWYGWNGHSNQGARLPAQAVARGILERERGREDPPMDYRVGDTEMWAQKSGGPSVIEWFEETDARLTMRQAEKDRRRNYNEVLSRLAGSQRYMEDGESVEDPMFFVTADCAHWWRTVPTLVLDDMQPEKGPETKRQEDHCYDETCYALRSRPFMTSKEDRMWEEHGEWLNRHMRKSEDPYATVRH